MLDAFGREVYRGDHVAFTWSHGADLHKGVVVAMSERYFTIEYDAYEVRRKGNPFAPVRIERTRKLPHQVVVYNSTLRPIIR